MEKERSPGNGHGPGSGLPPIPTPRHSPFPSPTGGGAFKQEPSLSPVATSAGMVMAVTQAQQPLGQDGGGFSNDISKMPDFPSRNVGHRRAHSEILSLPDDISFDSDLGVVGSGDGPSLSDEAEDDIVSMFMDMEKFGSFSVTSGSTLAEGSSGAANNASSPPVPPTTPAENSAASSSSEKPRIRHQHSQSMDGSTSIKSEMLSSGSDGSSLAESKKAMSAAKLADLALVDPKRAKRIWANRQSAARSKERKMRYISELERKVQTLQTEATTLSAQLTMLQRDTTGLTTENSELKLRLQTMEQQVHLQDALNDALREEVQRLKIMTAQVIPNGGPLLNYGSSPFCTNQQFYPQNHNIQSLLATHQLQQLNIHSQHQLLPNQLQQQVPPTELKIRPPPPPSPPVASPSQNRKDGSSDPSGE